MEGSILILKISNNPFFTGVASILTGAFFLIPTLKGIKKNGPVKQDGKLERGLKQWIAMAIIFIALGCWSIVYDVMELGIINVSYTAKETLNCVVGFIFGIVFLVGYRSFGKGMYVENKDDLYVDAFVLRVINYREYYDLANLPFIMPGRKRVELIYERPDDGEQCTYQLRKSISLKKHPIGSTYKLRYSVLDREAYDEESEKRKGLNKLTMPLLFFGVILTFGAIVRIIQIYS